MSFFLMSFNAYMLVSLADAPVYLQVKSHDQYTLPVPPASILTVCHAPSAPLRCHQIQCTYLVWSIPDIHSMFVAYFCDAMLLLTHAHMVVISSMRGNVCTCNITKCLFKHAHSISTTLQWQIHQHDRGVYNHGIDYTVDQSPMRHCGKSYPSHPDSSLHQKKCL